jgi:hypothetical protein
VDADAAALAALLERGDHMELQRLVLEEPPLIRAAVPGYGVPPLCVLCASPHLELGDPLADDLVTCIEVLLAAGADPAQRCGPVTAVTLAASHPDALQLLLDAGADPPPA